MRQREGIELAKKEGKFKGRLKKYHKNHAGMNYAVKLYKEGNMTVNQICLELHYIESYPKGTNSPSLPHIPEKDQIVERHGYCVMLKSGKYCKEMHLK